MNSTKEIVMKKWQKEIASRLVADVVREAMTGRETPSSRQVKKLARKAAKAAVIGMRKINASN